MNINLGQAEGS